MNVELMRFRAGGLQKRSDRFDHVVGDIALACAVIALAGLDKLQAAISSSSARIRRPLRRTHNTGGPSWYLGAAGSWIGR